MVGGSTSLRARVGLGILVGGYGLLDLVAATPDSPLRPVLPAGAGPAAWLKRGADWLGLDGFSRLQLTVLSIVVLAVLVGSFGLVMVEAWRGRVRLGTVLAFLGVSLVLAVAAPVLLSRDVSSYAAYGRIFGMHGANPYVVPPSSFPSDPFVRAASPEWVHSPSVYGPAFTWLSAGVAKLLSGSVPATLLAFKTVAALSVGGACVLVAATARVIRPGREAAAAAALGLNPVVVVHTVGGGHNDALLALCGAAGLLLAVRSRDGERAGRPAMLGATAVLTLAVLIKSVALPLLVLWLWQAIRRSPSNRRRVEMLTHAGVVVVMAVAAFAAFVADGRAARALLSVASRQGWASGPGLVARGGRALGRAMGGRATGAALEVAVGVAFAALFLLLFWGILQRRQEPEDAWGRSMLLLALSAPYLLPWYAAWFLPFAVFLQDTALTRIALASAGLLALTGVPAEPATDPGLWRAMMLGVHYGAAPLMLVMLAGAVRRTLAGTGRAVRPVRGSFSRA